MWVLSECIDARAVTICHLCTARSSFGLYKTEVISRTLC
jgi:hypothetical protein